MKARTSLFLASIAIFFISLVLRPPVASVGPLLGQISTDLGLSSIQTGVLASAPVLCFGLGAFASPALVRRFGLQRAMLLVLGVLLAASFIRLWLGFPGLMLGTLGVGLSIAVANVLLPTVVRAEFPNRVPLITGAYTTLLAFSASFAAATAVPSSETFGGWRSALAIWLVPALFALVFWFLQSRGHELHVPQTVHSAAEEKAAVIRSPITWAVVALFGLQSLGFYAILGWLPTMLIDSGQTPAAAGGYLGLATAVGVPAGLVLSTAIGRFKSLAVWVVGASLATLSGFVLLLGALRNPELIAPACILMGLGQASSFPLALSIIGTRAATKAQTTQLSALAQGWGYLIAALGTFLVGALAQSSGNWGNSVWLLIAITVLQLGAGYFAGRPGLIPAK